MTIKEPQELLVRYQQSIQQPVPLLFDITFNDVTSDAGTRYQIWYKAVILSVWKDGTLQYSNVANASVDPTTYMTRYRCSAGHKILRPRGASPDPAGPGWGYGRSDCGILILLRFHIDRNILQSSGAAVESR